MAKIPFDIKFRPQIESGEYKVETNDGRKVRIVCWDMINASYNDIVALVASSISGNENAIIYYQDGKCKSDSSGLGRKDLVIITPEPEFTEFEEAVGELIKEAVHNEVGDNAVVYAIGRGWTDKLLDLARKELVKEGTSKNEMGTMLYDAGFEDGKAEALKDLPRWRKCADGPKPKPSNEWIFSIDSENVTRESAIVHKGYFLPLDGLEKLPGFKED